MLKRVLCLLGAVGSSFALGQVAKPAAAQEVIVWTGYGGDAQHSAQSKYPMANVGQVAWSASLDLNVSYSGSGVPGHYGELALTTNTAVVIQRQKTGKFMFSGLSTATGATNWFYISPYVLPPSYMYDWLPPVSGTLLPNGSYVGPSSGGGVFVRPHVDAPNQIATTYHKCGSHAYTAQGATYDANLFICTPITADSAGSIYYGVRALKTLPDGTQSGWIKMTVNGTYSMYTSQSGYWPAMNAGPAVSPDGKTVYVAESQTGAQAGQIVSLNAATMQFNASAPVLDPTSGDYGWLTPDSTASPLVGPDGDVYYGVLENPFHSDRGWLIHWDSNLNLKGVPGGFGWDDTPSIVPSTSVPSYTGSAKYLLFCKYNNYADGGLGGDGRNEVAIVDPTASSADPRVPAQQVMNPVIQVVGITPDPSFDMNPATPDAVREWCINSAAVDAAGKCIAVNSEDGSMYRLDMTTGTLTNKVVLTGGVGEAYTPTAIGSDGTVYAVSDARVFAIKPKPTKVKVVAHRSPTSRHPITSAQSLLAKK